MQARFDPVDAFFSSVVAHLLMAALVATYFQLDGSKILENKNVFISEPQSDPPYSSDIDVIKCYSAVVSNCKVFRFMFFFYTVNWCSFPYVR